jgi:hypothetical protein
MLVSTQPIIGTRPQFNGIVCALLGDEEVWKLHHRDDTVARHRSFMCPSMTEGVICTVDGYLVEDCLAELDFRKKGVRMCLLFYSSGIYFVSLRVVYFVLCFSQQTCCTAAGIPTACH